MKELILKRVPPGDRWEDAVDKSNTFDSLTEGLEYAFQKSKGRIKEFHLSSFDGEIYYVLPDPELPPEPPKQYSLYGEEII
jgi:hypothetical protein|tara:strand:- start:918 stop:1160 length:243 start_codon:yes stop_codon:yes gene_type:complete